ncbi:DNA polymerase IV [Marinomonas sp. 15G1-11]|uniref:DNA polymerase IV n=1 Tax=Marinomonas phaeophyticola TaxID=3004091 RepID=A0ABT4JUQ1_9GAMM|nr:DNA polymerase IV [Marinomonas sp. 15G1-11]MCZ2722136.1 DNA polymerase IV [Marinomonas sp. 15G1-11]
MSQRKIIHIDADCFFAAVEMRDNPKLRDIPLAIGGAANSRGVISTANYVAREYGVRSAMSSAQAVRQCPHLTIIPGNMQKYRDVSQKMRQIFSEYTSIIEPLSLDEAYLDVTDISLCRGSATLMAEEIRQKIEASTGITVSAGIAANKFLAKVASDWNKPNGLFVVVPSNQAEFVKTIPIKRIWGIGKVGQEKLNKLGVVTCGDLQQLDFTILSQQFGRFAHRLSQLALGIDEREVQVNRIRKSFSIEHTYEKDLASTEACLMQVPKLMEELRRRMENKKSTLNPSKFYVKVKFDNFQQTTVEKAYQKGQEYTFFIMLMKEAISRQNRPVRLLGLGYRLTSNDSMQLSLPLE